MRFNTLSLLVGTGGFLGYIQAAAACQQQSSSCNGAFGACCAGLSCISATPSTGTGTCQGCQKADLPCNDGRHGPCCAGLTCVSAFPGDAGRTPNCLTGSIPNLAASACACA
ncbi:hypothetical protein FB451DRAFT_1192298 [Mycena latifolia]|nr:hypothetical protein FB451DRAFT_1192298 [Mycena latifolia]